MAELRRPQLRFPKIKLTGSRALNSPESGPMTSCLEWRNFQHSITPPVQLSRTIGNPLVQSPKREFRLLFSLPVLVAAFLDPSGPLATVRVRRDEERPCEQNAIDRNASGDDVYPVHG